MRRVLRLIERTIDMRGHALRVPELALEGWTTSLPTTLDTQAVIALYADHGTHEQLIYRAGRLIQTGRRLILGLGAHNRAAKVFMRSFAQFAATS